MKTRFAPSPTGSMHLGNVRTALFSALLAKSKGGSFLLRIEDTDAFRSEEKYNHAIFEDLYWLNLLWQEGPGKDQGNGPYYQLERREIYDQYYHKLEEAELAYPCFCSERQLSVMRKSQLASGNPPRYTGICSQLSTVERAEKLAAGLEPTLRFRVPKGTKIEFMDLVKGIQSFHSDDIGDFIIRRANGTASFMFCNAIDDALMGVTHVMRGADHVTNTPRQIMLLQALGLPVPEYGHISLIIGFDGAPLSKRHGSSSLGELRDEGVLPAALLNYLARLGHAYEQHQLLSFDELAEYFKVESLSQSPAKFDHAQLSHWQKLAIPALSQDALWAWMGSQVHSIVPNERRDDFLDTVSPNILSPDDAFYWANLFFSELEITDQERIHIIREAGVDFYDQAMKAVTEHHVDYKKICEVLKENLSVKGKGLFLPIRVALTGETHGPELAPIFKLLGSERIIQRFQAARALC